MVQIVCVNGFPGSGKTTFERYCMDILGYYSSQKSTVDYCKEIAKQCGWDGIEKTPEVRKFLSDLKDLLTNSPWGDVPINQIINYCNEIDYNFWYRDEENDSVHFVFVDVREPKSLQFFAEQFNAITVLVQRPTDETQWFSNHADENVLHYDYNFIIENSGTLEELEAMAEVFCHRYLLKDEEEE